MFENHIQGAYYHGNGGCQTVDMVFRSENSQLATNNRDADIRSLTNRAVRILASVTDLNFVSVTDPEVIRRTEPRRQ